MHFLIAFWIKACFPYPFHIQWLGFFHFKFTLITRFKFTDDLYSVLLPVFSFHILLCTQSNPNNFGKFLIISTPLAGIEVLFVITMIISSLYYSCENSWKEPRFFCSYSQRKERGFVAVDQGQFLKSSPVSVYRQDNLFNSLSAFLWFWVSIWCYVCMYILVLNNIYRHFLAFAYYWHIKKKIDYLLHVLNFSYFV